MQAEKIDGATRALGAPRDWNEERDGSCGTLPIRDERFGGLPAMVSAWRPSPDDLAILNAGGVIHLRIVGAVHPPVMLEVGK